MLICKKCSKTIVNVGNPRISYSTCTDCRIDDLLGENKNNSNKKGKE